MDFSTVRKKLDSGAYATLEQFEVRSCILRALDSSMLLPEPSTGVRSLVATESFVACHIHFKTFLQLLKACGQPLLEVVLCSAKVQN